MPAKSLVKLSTEACISNFRSIDDVADAPYHLVRPILLKIENPQQLREIESKCPQIAGADAELWQHFIKRDIRNWESKMIEPKNPQSWGKVYRRLRKEAEDETRRKEEALKAALNSKTEEKQSNQMRYIDQVIDPRKKTTKPTYNVSRTPNASVLSFAGGSRTKMTTGKGILDRAKREAREASLFSARRTVLSTPTHRLTDKIPQGRIVGPNGVLSPAPASFVPRDRIQTPSATGSRPGSAWSGPNPRPSGPSTALPAKPQASAGSPITLAKRPAVSVFVPQKKRKV